MQPDEWVVNLNNAFSTAQDKLGIYSLLDATDVAVERPDEKSIMTYVAALYHYFSSMAKEDVASQRVSNMVQELDEIQALEEDYDRRGLIFSLFLPLLFSGLLNISLSCSRRSPDLDQGKC